MGKINIKGGTPVGSASLCRTCSWAHIINGYRESEVLVICTDVSPNIAVPFTVRECTCYNDRNRPTWAQMQKLAINVSAPIRFGKSAGFAAADARARENEEEDEEVEEDALIAD